MSSTRLPGKNLKPILGKPMVGRLLERLRHARMLDGVCVATSTDPSDDVLDNFVRAEGCDCFRGSLEDVLDRVVGAAQYMKADILVEITGDCAVADPAIIDAAVRRHLKGDADYVANILERISFPIGFDVQVYSAPLLAEIAQIATDPYDRNNVTPYFYRNPQRYRLLNLYAPPELDRPDYFMCVDYPHDFEVITTIYENLYPKNPAFSARDIIAFLDAHPDIAARNARSGKKGHSTGGAARQEMMVLP